MRALSIHIRKAILGENGLSAHSCYFGKKKIDPQSNALPTGPLCSADVD